MSKTEHLGINKLVIHRNDGHTIEIKYSADDTGLLDLETVFVDGEPLTISQGTGTDVIGATAGLFVALTAAIVESDAS